MSDMMGQQLLQTGLSMQRPRKKKKEHEQTSFSLITANLTSSSSEVN